MPETSDYLKSSEKRQKILYYVQKLFENGILVVSAAGNLGPQNNSLSLMGESPKTICVGDEIRKRCIGGVNRHVHFKFLVFSVH